MSSAPPDESVQAPPSPTRVLVVDDHEVVRAGLISLIAHEEDLVICGEAATESATLEAARAAQPDVAVVDWSLGPRDAAPLLERLRAVSPQMPVLVLSMHDERHYAERAVRAGASGYVMKHEASGKIIAAIRAVAAGQRYFSERALHALAALASPPEPRASVKSHEFPHARWSRPLLIALILFAVGFALYEFTLPFPFVFDDHPYLVKNPLWTDARSFLFLTHFTEFANRAASLGLNSDLSTNFILRPFAYFTFYLNHLAGGISPTGYRAVNVLIHSANAALLFAFVSRLLSLARGHSLSATSRQFIAWLAALLFLVHPLHIESVTYIIQRFTSLGTTFYLGSVLLFLMARVEENGAQARRWRRWSVAALLLGMLTKEFLFTAPVAMVLLDRVLLGTPLREAVKHARPWLLCLPLIPVLLLATAAAQSGEGLSYRAILDVASPAAPVVGSSNVAYQHHYALTQPGVVLTYLRMLVLPYRLNIDPDHPITMSAFEWRFLGPFTTLLLLAWGGIWLIRRRSDPREVLAGIGVLWFFLTLAIDSSVIPLPDVMAEHRAYLPSLGIAIAVACLADLARARFAPGSPQRLLAPAAGAIAVLALSAATVARNEVWRSSVTLWEDAVAKSPGKVRPWMNLGTAYHEMARWSPSVDCYRRALRLAPTNANLWAYLAVAENTTGAYDRALAAAQEGLRFDPAVGNLHLARAYALERLRRPQEALAAVQEWLRHKPGSRRALLGLSGLLLEVGHDEEAVRQMESLRALGGLTPEQQQAFERVEAALTERRKQRQALPQQRATAP